MSDLIGKLKNSKLLTILLSVLIACIMWFYVDAQLDPDINDTIRGVPITLVGQEELERDGLMITQLSTEELDIRLTGKREALFSLTNKNLKVTCDVSSIARTGTYELSCAVVLPGSNSAVSVNNRENYRVSVTVDERKEKTVEVRGEFAGSLAKGYRGGEFTLSPSQIQLSGPAGLLEQVAWARVVLNIPGLKESYSGTLPVELVGENGEILSQELIQCEDTSVYAFYPVSMEKEISLSVELAAGGGAKAENVTCEIFPKTLTVYGREEDLSGLDTLSLGTIELAEIGENSVVLLPITLPAGVQSESEGKEAKITIAFHDLTVRAIDVTRFEWKNVPDGWSARLLSGVLTVTVRGPKDQVEAIRPGQLSAVIDLSGVEHQAGEVRVPVKVVLTDGGEAGVVDTDYTVTVELSQS